MNVSSRLIWHPAALPIVVSPEIENCLPAIDGGSSTTRCEAAVLAVCFFDDVSDRGLDTFRTATFVVDPNQVA